MMLPYEIRRLSRGQILYHGRPCFLAFSRNYSLNSIPWALPCHYRLRSLWFVLGTTRFQARYPCCSYAVIPCYPQIHTETGTKISPLIYFFIISRLLLIDNISKFSLIFWVILISCMMQLIWYTKKGFTCNLSNFVLQTGNIWH